MTETPTPTDVNLYHDGSRMMVATTGSGKREWIIKLSFPSEAIAKDRINPESPIGHALQQLYSLVNSDPHVGWDEGYTFQIESD